MSEHEPISLILLAYQEAETIEAEIRAFHDIVVSRLPGSEFIVAEDGSTDGTSEIVQRLAAELGVIHLTSPERKGYRKALVDAVLAAKHEFIFFSDTGLKHDPQDFWKLYPLRHEYDLIVGRKTNRQDQWYRRLLTWAYNLYLRWLFGLDNVHDADSGFRLFNRRVVEQVFRQPLLFSGFIGSEIVLRSVLCGLRYYEVPVSYAQRRGASRGLPLRSIPREIWKVIRNLRLLKAELTGTRAAGPREADREAG